MDDLFGSERRNTTGEFCGRCAPCFAVNYGAANAAVFCANAATCVVFAAASSAMQWMFCWRCAPRIAAYATTFEGVCGSSSVFAAIIEQRARRFAHEAHASAATKWVIFWTASSAAFWIKLRNGGCSLFYLRVDLRVVFHCDGHLLGGN